MCRFLLFIFISMLNTPKKANTKHAVCKSPKLFSRFQRTELVIRESEREREEKIVYSNNVKSTELLK